MRSNKDKLLKWKEKDTGYSILYMAVRAGHYPMVQFILENGCNLDFSKDRSTPMHCAAYYGHYSIIPLLLAYKISVKVKNRFDSLPV
jgi:ankyrin repeat protein